MKKFLFIAVLCAVFGCCADNEHKDYFHAALLSETSFLIQGQEILLSDGYVSDDKIVQQIRSVMGWDLCNMETRTVLLKIRGDVRYGVMWFVVRALNRMGCAVEILCEKSETTVRTLTRDSFLGLDYYLVDDVEMRFFGEIKKSIPYSRGEASAVAQKVIMEKRETHSYLEIRCYALMLVRDFLDVLSVVKEKGYDGVNLSFPLAVKVSEGVDAFLKGEDGL